MSGNVLKPSRGRNMDVILNGWFSEVNDMWDGICLSLQIEKILHKEKSEYQDIMILQTKSHGIALILDGIIQCTEFDEFSYQEMISFLPLCVHSNPKNVLIVGGGDGGVAREVSKHDAVESIDMVEIDGRVIEVSKKYLPNMAIGFNSPKLNLHVKDGFEFVKQHKNKYDVIITDSSDPIGPATCLFQKEYFILLKESLKPDGVICCQAGSIWCNLDTATKSYNLCKEVFSVAGYARFSVPTYPSGEIGLVIASTNPNLDLTKPVFSFSEKELAEKNLRYYDSQVHSAAFVLPRCFAQHFR